MVKGNQSVPRNVPNCRCRQQGQLGAASFEIFVPGPTGSGTNRVPLSWLPATAAPLGIATVTSACAGACSVQWRTWEAPELGALGTAGTRVLFGCQHMSQGREQPCSASLSPALPPLPLSPSQFLPKLPRFLLPDSISHQLLQSYHLHYKLNHTLRNNFIRNYIITSA